MCVMTIVASFDILLLCSICQGSGQPPDVSETLTFNLLVYMYMQTIEVLWLDDFIFDHKQTYVIVIVGRGLHNYGNASNVI